MVPAVSDANLAESIPAHTSVLPLLVHIVIFSFFVNLLGLSGPLFMLNVYDRVLRTGSESTLVALLLLVVFLYVVLVVLDGLRRNLTRAIGTRIEQRAARRAEVHDFRGADGKYQLGAQLIQRAAASPAILALFDLPWSPVFLGALYLLHPWLAYLAVAGFATLVLLATGHHLLTKKLDQSVHSARRKADDTANVSRATNTANVGNGLDSALWRQWIDESGRATALSNRVAGRTDFTFAMSKFVRMLLQSAMLGLAAYLVLKGQMTAGGMIASSILVGRCLAPIESLISHGSTLRDGMRGLRLLRAIPAKPDQHSSNFQPLPTFDTLEVSNLAVMRSNRLGFVFRDISFKISAGQSLALTGPSGCGKTLLARVLANIQQPTAGRVSVGGYALPHLSAHEIERKTGYLPQRVELLPGTIAENIASFMRNADPESICEAAREAGVHEQILALPHGYNSVVEVGNLEFSDGELRRLGLARALFRKPPLLILDTPEACFQFGTSDMIAGLISRATAKGRIVVAMSNDSSIVSRCDLVLDLGASGKLSKQPKRADKNKRPAMRIVNRAASTL